MTGTKKRALSLTKTILASALSAHSWLAGAAPTGGVAVSGGISIGTMNNNELVITQALQKGIINWTDFSIDAGELVRFAQNAGNDSITLNRVLGSQVSNIQGALHANGNIFLINPNGIVFGAGSQTDVAGLLATTFDVTDQSFLNGGQLNFTQVAGKDLASIANQGQITAGTGGFVYLVAPKVDNSGFVIANVGRATLAAGDRFSVNLQGSNLINFSVSASTLAAATGSDLTGVSNSGTVSAQTVLLYGNAANGMMSSVVNNSGIIEATDLTIQSADIVQGNTIKGVGTAAATKASLEASNSITTTSNSSTRATTLTLSVNDEGATLGSATEAVRFDADVLNATTAGGGAWLTDVSGGVALDTVKAGTGATATTGGNVVITAQNGSITSTDPSKVNVLGASAQLIADGSVGTDSTAIHTQVGTLSASTQNGGIHIQNDGALTLLDVIAREQITVNNLPTSSAAVDNSGSITLSNGSTGTKNVTIRASEDITLTDTVSATNTLAITSDIGSIQAGQVGTNLVGRTLNLSAGGAIGSVGQSLNTQSNLVNASAGNGGIYLTESNGLTIGTITAAGTANNVVLEASQGNLEVGSVTATGGSVALIAGAGGILANGSGTNVTANSLTTASKTATGAANKALATAVNVIDAATTAAQAGIYISNSSALQALSASTPNGDVNVTFTGGSLVYSRNLSALTLNRAQALDLAFSNTASGIKLNGIDAGSNQTVSLTAAGAITQGSGSVVGKNVHIDASGNIGSGATALQIDASSVDLTSRNGLIHVANTSSDLDLSATATSLNGAVTVSQRGNLTLQGVNARGNIDVQSGGALTIADTVSSTGGDIALNGASIQQNATVETAGTGNIHAQSNDAIVMASTSLTRAEAGTIRYESGGSISVGSIQTSTGTNGGSVVLVAAELIDTLPGQVNVTAQNISLSAQNLTSALVHDLTGATAPEATDDKTSGSTGGNAALASRHVIAPLLSIPSAQNTPAETLLTSGALLERQIRPIHAFVEDEDGVLLYKP